MAIDIDLSEDRQFRLTGEDAPLWPAAAFAVLGAALAFAASAQIFAPPAPPPLVAPVEAATPPAPVAAPEPAAPAQAEVAAKEAPPEAPAEVVARETPPAVPVEPSRPASEPVSIAAATADTRPADAPAPTPIPAAAPAACLPVILIPFDLNSSRLKSTGLDAVVTPLRAWLGTHKDAVLSVEGHADATGPEAYNVVLSYKRAEAAAAWLVQAGAAPDQIATRAAGTRALARGLATGGSNRQVILQIEGVEPCRDDGAATQNP